jgi:hypothetical protein
MVQETAQGEKYTATLFKRGGALRTDCLQAQAQHLEAKLGLYRAQKAMKTESPSK